MQHLGIKNLTFRKREKWDNINSIGFAVAFLGINSPAVILASPASVPSSQSEMQVASANSVANPEDLLFSPKIQVASKFMENIDVAPGSLTMITKKDIERNHCRDLVDVFNMVPGFNIVAQQNLMSLASLGIFTEGRILIMVDGLQLSDLGIG